MRKIVISMHVSLDGFAAGPHGEMDWIKVDKELFDFVGEFTREADAALYGRRTWEMMDNYWPEAGNKPAASKHDIEHSGWYNSVNKIVLSRSLNGTKKDKTIFIGENCPGAIRELKKQPGKNILIFGSPGAAHTLIQHNLIDEYWLFVNPVILGEGIPFLSGAKTNIPLKFVGSKVFSCGVVALHHVV